MRKYGDQKTHTHVEGHQDCGICHPPIKNAKKRARRIGKAQTLQDVAANITFGYMACWKETPNGNCRMPKDHEGECV